MNLPIIAISLLVPITVFVYMFSLWKKYGKDEEPKNVVMQSEPPKGITPAMAGYVFSNKFIHLRSLVSTIIDMAVKGLIELEISAKKNKIINITGNNIMRKIIPYNPKLKQLARNLRNNSTLSEVLLWQHLKNKKMKGLHRCDL